MFLTEDEVLMGYKDTDQNISARSLTLLLIAVEQALCGRPQPEHESVMPLPLSPLNVLIYYNSILCQETSSESGLLRTFYLFTSSNNMIFNGKSYCQGLFQASEKRCSATPCHCKKGVELPLEHIKKGQLLLKRVISH